MYSSSLLIVFIVVIGTSNKVRADLSKLEFSDCGSTAVTIDKIDLTPMPVTRPGTGNLTLSVNIKRPISNFRLSVTVVRTVSGIVLPVKCYKLEGTTFGSCEYSSTDLCRYMTYWWPQFFGAKACSSVLLAMGIDCTCPFNTLRAQTVNINNKKIDIPEFARPILSYFSTGDFSIKLVAYEQSAPTNEPLFCGTFKYTVKTKGSVGK